MSAIGPGDWVQRVRDCRDLTTGAIYRVKAIEIADIGCEGCGNRQALRLYDKRPLQDSREWRWAGWCPCGFAPWPPPAVEVVRSEPADHDVREPA